MDLGCVICHESFKASDLCVVTKCGHMFHNQCVSDWIYEHQSCPSCRAHRTRADLIRVYLSTMSMNGMTPTSSHNNWELQKENRKLQGKIKMTENNLNQKIRSLEQRLIVANKRTDSLRDNELETENENLRGEIRRLTVQQKSMENTKNQNIRNLENKIKTISTKLQGLGDQLISMSLQYQQEPPRYAL